MSVATRMKEAIQSKTNDRSRYLQLKEITGISGDVWKNFWFGRREPDARMLEALARAWPEFGFWLSTGATDVKNGHICPSASTPIESPASYPITSQPFFRAGVEAAQAIETALQLFPEQAESISVMLLDLLNGKSFHRMPNEGVIQTDSAIKRLKEVARISQLRAQEMQEKGRGGDQKD